MSQSLEDKMHEDLITLIHDIYDDILANVPGIVKKLIRRSLVDEKVDVFARRITMLSHDYVVAKYKEEHNSKGV